MQIEDVPFQIADWKGIKREEHRGETGTSFWRTVEVGNIRVRIVEYSANYRADHWCRCGHVVYVLAGELLTELQDGRSFTLRAGESYQVGENQEPHRSSSAGGATLFIVD